MFTNDNWLSPLSVRNYFFKMEMRPVQREEAEVRAALKRADTAFASFLRRITGARVLLSDGRIVEVDRNFLTRVFLDSPFCHEYFDFQTGMIGRTDMGFRVLYYVAKSQTMAALRSPLQMSMLIVTALMTVILFFGIPFFLMENHQKSSADHLGEYTSVAYILISVLLFNIPKWLLNHRAKVVSGPYRGGHLIFDPTVAYNFVTWYYASQEDQPSMDSEIAELASGIDKLADDEELCARAIIAAYEKQTSAGGRIIKEDAWNQFGNMVSSRRAFDRSWRLAAKVQPSLGSAGRPRGTY
jgi:hypothetical protein